MLIKLTLPWVPEPFGAAAGRATGEAAETPRVSQWTPFGRYESCWEAALFHSENLCPPFWWERYHPKIFQIIHRSSSSVFDLHGKKKQQSPLLFLSPKPMGRWESLWTPLSHMLYQCIEILDLYKIKSRSKWRRFQPNLSPNSFQNHPEMPISHLEGLLWRLRPQLLWELSLNLQQIFRREKTLDSQWS